MCVHDDRGYESIFADSVGLKDVSGITCIKKKNRNKKETKRCIVLLGKYM